MSGFPLEGQVAISLQGRRSTDVYCAQAGNHQITQKAQHSRHSWVWLMLSGSPLGFLVAFQCWITQSTNAFTHSLTNMANHGKPNFRHHPQVITMIPWWCVVIQPLPKMVGLYGGVHTQGEPSNGWFIMEKTHRKWMIWDHPYVRKPPTGSIDRWILHYKPAILGFSMK